MRKKFNNNNEKKVAITLGKWNPPESWNIMQIGSC